MSALSLPIFLLPPPPFSPPAHLQLLLPGNRLALRWWNIQVFLNSNRMHLTTSSRCGVIANLHLPAGAQRVESWVHYGCYKPAPLSPGIRGRGGVRHHESANLYLPPDLSSPGTADDNGTRVGMSMSAIYGRKWLQRSAPQQSVRAHNSH
jgi:hypothetical protein